MDLDSASVDATGLGNSSQVNQIQGGQSPSNSVDIEMRIDEACPDDSSRDLTTHTDQSSRKNLDRIGSQSGRTSDDNDEGMHTNQATMNLEEENNTADVPMHSQQASRKDMGLMSSQSESMLEGNDKETDRSQPAVEFQACSDDQSPTESINMEKDSGNDHRPSNWYLRPQDHQKPDDRRFSIRQYVCNDHIDNFDWL